MSILSRLFGGSTSPEAPDEPTEIYKGFRIAAAPQSDSGGYRVGARIEKEVDGEVKVHHLVRADTLRGFDEAAALSLRKARQMIDEQGERIFR